MQTSCPKCSNRLVLDDAKIPATPFMLKCPKCQGTIKLPGRSATASVPETSNPSPPTTAAPEAPKPQPAATNAPPTPPPARPAAAPPAEVEPAPASGPSPMPSPASGPAGTALVSLPGEAAGAVSAILSRLGFTVEQLNGEEQLLRLQEGDYAAVAISRNGVSSERNVYQMVQSLPSDVRRRLFLLLVGDEFKSGEGAQAFAVLADLVLNGKDVAGSERLVFHAMNERRRIFQTFLDAEDRKTEGKL